ncbi:MAG: LuxR C-terminal-related transcriptional regulator [Anaerolineae bacterium]
MPASVLATKLFVPQLRPGAVRRPHLVGRLNAELRQNGGFARKLTLISAPAGFGKTTLAAEWVAGLEQFEPKVRVAWLSLEVADSDPLRFLAYLIATLQTIETAFGADVLVSLQAPHPPPMEVLLTALLNETTAIPADFVLVLDDYHLVDSTQVDQAIAFLVEHLPPHMHVAIVTREDPQLPLARLRGRGQLVELRAADLRFAPAEVAEFLNGVMDLNLSAEDIAAMEARTEGWIAGLQLAALALQGVGLMRSLDDRTSFINSFTGSHRFVLDYLLEEVLFQQPASIQTFLLRTSILDRMCGPLCEAVAYEDDRPVLPASGQEMLEYLERANLFIIPLDGGRRWYRYHHLFADLLRQRLHALYPQQPDRVAQYHTRASQWYEDNALEIEAFRHAAAAHDIERAERLIQGGRIPLHSLPVVTAVLNWLEMLPKTILDARPWLWVRSATSSLMAGQTTGVEEKLQAAEKAMQTADLDARTRDLIGQIAAIRATLALLRYRPEATLIQARRALAYLDPDNQPSRSRAVWALGFAYQIQGDRAAAGEAYDEAIRLASGNTYYTVLASTCLGQLQESENQLHQAAGTYRRSLQLLSDQGPPNANEEYIGLARICYEWNDLEAAERHGRQSLQLARQYDPAIDRFIISEVHLARVRLAHGDGGGAAAMLAQAYQSASERGFTQQLPEIAAVQVLTLLHQGQVTAAAQLARQYDLPLSRARVLIAQGDASAALAVLEPVCRDADARGWADQRLRTMVLQVVGHYLAGEKDEAAHVLGEALALAEPGGFIRLFVDEGAPMRCALLDYRHRVQLPSSYVDRLLAAFAQPEAEPPSKTRADVSSPSPDFVEPLTQRELEILRLIAQGLSNQEIGARLFLALNTIKGHNRIIFEKLQVARRTEAVARARELGLL